MKYTTLFTPRIYVRVNGKQGPLVGYLGVTKREQIFRNIVTLRQQSTLK